MIGERILKLRKNKNLSQEELAEKLNVTRQTISNWELGETIPDLKQAKILAQVFNISIDELTGDHKDEKIYQRIVNTENNSHKTLKIVKTILIILVIIIALTLLITIFVFESFDYFKATPQGSSIATKCNYKNNVIYYEVTKDYQSNDLSLITTDEEIINKFKPYDYSSKEKMLDDIVKYIEANGGSCGSDNFNED